LIDSASGTVAPTRAAIRSVISAPPRGEVRGGPQQGERGEVDPGDVQPGLLDRVYRGQHRLLRRRDEQPAQGLAVLGRLQREEVQQRLVHRQRQHLAHLERQRLA